jgi:hypothetical protein
MGSLQNRIQKHKHLAAQFIVPHSYQEVMTQYIVRHSTIHKSKHNSRCRVIVVAVAGSTHVQNVVGEVTSDRSVVT